MRAIAAEYVELGGHEEARSLLKSLKEVGRVSEIEFARVISYIAQKQIEAGVLEEAKETARLQDIPALYINSLFGMARFLIEGDKEEGAALLQSEAEEKALYHQDSEYRFYLR